MFKGDVAFFFLSLNSSDIVLVTNWLEWLEEGSYCLPSWKKRSGCEYEEVLFSSCLVGLYVFSLYLRVQSSAIYFIYDSFLGLYEGNCYYASRMELKGFWFDGGNNFWRVDGSLLNLWRFKWS